MHTTKCLLLLSILTLTSALWSQTTIIRVPEDYSDIASAIGQASSVINGPSPSDVVIKVGPGTYEGPFDLSPINNPTYSVSLLATSGPSMTRLERPDHRGSVLGAAECETSLWMVLPSQTGPSIQSTLAPMG
jgi:hypothetical protein